MRAVDYIIVGQGLAGSCLTLELLKRNKKLVVVDSPQPNSASKIATGVFNPITGRTNQPTWRVNEIFKTLFDFYTATEKLLGTSFLYRLPVYRPFLSNTEYGNWPSESNDWIQNIFTQPQYINSVNDLYGGILIKHSGYLNTTIFLSAVQSFIRSQCELLQERFDFDRLEVSDKVIYKNYEAEKIIFCEGCEVKNNPWFNWFEIRKLKGELLLAKAELPRDVILNRGIFSVPANGNEFVIGSTYVHDELEGSTSAGKEDILSRAKKMFKKEIEIVSQSWGHRPTTIDRRPVLGSHPTQPTICVFNGLGTKGVSLAPFFALHLADWLDGKIVLDKEVNIERFYSLSFKSK